MPTIAGSVMGHGVCDRGAGAAASDALYSPVGALLTRMFG
jgi:hypothetical protein